MMKHVVNDLKVPFLLILFVGLCAVFCLPIVPSDETRYVSAAWEMWTNHSFAVPLLNGEPYSHKPPLLFWAMHVGWTLFGVNDITPRLTITLFSLMSLLPIYLIARRLWPEDRRAAALALLILSSTWIWVVWSCAIMFDMVLSFFVLVGSLGILRAADGRKGGWALLAAGTAGGLLAKGPAVFVYLMPLLIFQPFWSRPRVQSPGRARWALCSLAAVLAGLAVALLWAVPAVIQGGEEYRHAVLWGQTVNRMADSFAHRRPVWWYLPLLPLFFMPWLLFQPRFSRSRLNISDNGQRFCLVWIGGPLLVFSLISGKQFQYLVPFIPAAALLFGKRLASLQTGGNPITARWIGGIYLAVGLVAFCAQFLGLDGDFEELRPGSTLVASAVFIGLGLFLCLARFKSMERAVQAVATATILVAAAIFFQARTTFLERYRIKPVAMELHKHMEDGRQVIHIGKYRGQYQFLGRLTRPLLVIELPEQEIAAAVQDYQDALFVSNRRERDASHIPEGSKILYEQPYRGKTVQLWELPPKDD